MMNSRAQSASRTSTVTAHVAGAKATAGTAKAATTGRIARTSVGPTGVKVPGLGHGYVQI